MGLEGSQRVIEGLGAFWRVLNGGGEKGEEDARGILGL